MVTAECYIECNAGGSVTPKEQNLLEVFDTARPSNTLFCHQEFLEKLADHSNDPIGRRAAFLLQRLAVDARRLHYKSTSGANRGWRRSRLGGNGGSHFYAWWAPRNAPPLEGCADFPAEESIYLRDIRHHDDHAPLSPQAFEANYLPVTVRELRREEYGPSPWTPTQTKFASGRQAARLLKGHPGSGKTTALWHAADQSGAQRVLYVTYSRDLAALAREYFDKFCSSHKQFQVVTFPDLVRRLANQDLPPTSDRESMAKFQREISGFSRNLGPWASAQTALYDEMHAHLVGDALPAAIGRFVKCGQPRVPERAYKERRTRFLGVGATQTVLDAAARLERVEPTTLAERYFPELGLAWRALERLTRTGGAASAMPVELLGVDCIAVDECQDLTPMEAMVLVELAAAMNGGRSGSGPILLAGDEAQTVRPTDFEWGWLSDLLHYRVGTPSDYKLSANLRSPRRIAELVNRVWDLYGHVQKQDRPSGTGYAQIEDDATDQVLYCAGAPGAELDNLFTDLAGREGLALISMEETVPHYVPEAVRPAVLTVREAKGLDFHSVCVIDAGRHLERILREQERVRVDSDIEDLRKRLAIDQLRVALSRPTERLIWLDVSPNEPVIEQSVRFLNRGVRASAVASAVPEALLKSLAEEELDLEERVQRCQADARQYLNVRPEMAWSRARQAVTLLGNPEAPAAVRDESVRETAYMTLAEICFALAIRGARMPAELGRPNLFFEAQAAATSAKKEHLGSILYAVGRLMRSGPNERLDALAQMADTFAMGQAELAPWVLTEIGPRMTKWVDELDGAAFSGHDAAVFYPMIAGFYEAIGIDDREQRTVRLKQRTISLLMRDKQWRLALMLVRQDNQPKLEAQCHEGLGDFGSAADCYRRAGDLKEALRCYRSVPDFESSLALVREMKDHPAAETLEWLARMRALAEQRPEKFNRVVLPAEKKLLEELLERSLGASRKKAAAKKAAAKKTAGTKRAIAPKKRAVKRVPPGNESF